MIFIVRDVKRKDAGPPCDEMFWSFDGAVGGDEVRNDEMGGKVRYGSDGGGGGFRLGAGRGGAGNSFLLVVLPLFFIF